MPTILEIQDPKWTYCKVYEDHCLCPKCKGRGQYCSSCTNCEKRYDNFKSIRPVKKCDQLDWASFKKKLIKSKSWT